MAVKFYVEPDELKSWRVGQEVFMRFKNPDTCDLSNILNGVVDFVDYGRSVIEIKHSHGHFPSNFEISVGRYNKYERVK